ncbi:cytochrome P450 [Streptomyces sp. NBC_00878]|uniref:cytochrome P450 n=1 Tax=Streptomyces sp. NBC_00878 TaxID=2975854 RepID=UPI002253A29A|nr:cytochrome P450 [Streptomyces sp. NBC_00878]MCX4903241.1 cytochrome P450 [Streptomyces sp. NBC_00878]
MTQPVAFPQDRTCPYHPPAYESLSRPLSRVTLYDGLEAWLVTGHAAARELFVDRRLSSRSDRPGFPIPSARLAGFREAVPALIGVDDPEHGTQRRMLIPGFTAKRTAALRPRIQETVDQLLDAMEAEGSPADLVSAFTLPLPSIVISAMLGVPYADHEFFEVQSRRLLRSTEVADAMDARFQLEEYFGKLIDRKQHERGHGGDGILDELVHNQLREGKTDRAELIALALVNLAGGHETTANMISLATFTLLQHPERLAELRADPALMPTAVEELLRFLSVSDWLLRVATEDIEIAGTTIRAGDGVVFSTSVINRDADSFPNPDVLDWHRSARHHVAFGFGIHQCIGSNLARAEMEIALRSLFSRFPDLRLALPADEIVLNPGDTVQGMLELPVAWERTRSEGDSAT